MIAGNKQPALFVRPKLTLPSRCPHPTLGRHPLSPRRAVPAEIRPFSQSDACARIGKAHLSYNAISQCCWINQTAARQIDNTGRDDLATLIAPA